jgi:glycosyltransferase involved in cell wall biosynthesis
MRILLLSNLYPPYVLGGAEILARDYAINLEELGHEVVVLTSSYGLPAAQQDGNTWRTLHYAPAARIDRNRSLWHQINLLTDYYQFFHYPANAKELQRVIAATKPDVLYVWEITGIGLNSMLKALMAVNLPVVFHLGNYWLHYALSPQTEQTRLHTRWLKKMLIGRVPSLTYTSLIAVSQSVKQEYAEAGCDAERIEVIYNGIDARFLTTARNEDENSHNTSEPKAKDIQLIYVGRLCVEKGVMVILQALDILVKEQNRYHFHLNIFGDGDEVYIRELEAFLQQKGLVQCVTFHGKVPQGELIKHYDRSEIMLVPSIWKEPFGLVVAEAMARGLPIIASNLGGPSEIVTHDVDGLLIEPGKVQALIAAILQLSADPAKCKQLGQAARSTVRERFLIEENAKRVEQHLQRAIPRKKFARGQP